MSLSWDGRSHAQRLSGCEGRRWRGMVLVFSHIKMLSGAMCCPPCQPSAVEGGGAVQSKNRNSKRGSLAFMAPLI